MSVSDEKDSTIYYVQISGLLQDQFCEKSAVLTWLVILSFYSYDCSFLVMYKSNRLIPTQSSPQNGFDPFTFILGNIFISNIILIPCM